MEAKLRCRMLVDEILHSKNAVGETAQERVTLLAVPHEPGSENGQWADLSKWHPFARFEVHISNPSAMGQLSIGQEFFLELSPLQSANAEKSQPTI